MLTSQYLYNIKPEELENKYYYEALDYKLICAKTLYNRMLYIPRKSEKESIRMFYIEKAMKHLIDLINEKDEM